MRKNFLGISAIVLGLALSAFTTISKQSSSITADEWFVLKPAGDPNNPLDYDPIEERPCFGDGAICGALAQEDPMNPGHPVFNSSTQYVKKP